MLKIQARTCIYIYLFRTLILEVYRRVRKPGPWGQFPTYPTADTGTGQPKYLQSPIVIQTSLYHSLKRHIPECFFQFDTTIPDSLQVFIRCLCNPFRDYSQFKCTYEKIT